MYTVDVPVLSKRERDLRNGFGRPRLPLRVYLEALRHPAWLFDYFRHGGGPPLFETYGMAAFGRAGAARAIEILRQEVEITLKQIGCPSLEALGPLRSAVCPPCPQRQ